MAVDNTDPTPLPDWAKREAARRLEEMRDPECGLSHEEVWKRIDDRDRASAHEDNTESDK